MSSHRIRQFQITGWLLFIVSAAFFTWSTAQAGDWIGVAASLLFLIACLVFLVPVMDRSEGVPAGGAMTSKGEMP